MAPIVISSGPPRATAAVPAHIHIFSPGDHYSPSTGSSSPTCIYELARQHQAHGGHTRVIVGRGANLGYPPYPVGEVVEVDYKPFPARKMRAVDAGLGAIGLPRPAKWASHAAACDAIPPDFAGWVISHGEAGFIRQLRRARPRAKILLYCHFCLFPWYTRAEVRRVIRDVDALACVSTYIADYVTGKAGLRPDNLGVVLNGVDAERFSPAAAPAGEHQILYVGRVHPDKGVHLLAAAALLLHARGRKFRLRVVGGQLLADGVPLSDYERQVREMAEPLGAAAEFVPFVPRSRLPDTYREASIACVPSTWGEPFNLVLAEALASGLPVVSSDRGALPEVAAGAALFFSPPDAGQLADQLERLLLDENLRRTMGQAARKRGEELSWACTYENLTALMARCTRGAG